MPVYLACVTTVDDRQRAKELLWATPPDKPIVAASSILAAREARERARPVWEKVNKLKAGQVRAHVIPYQSMPLS